MPRRSRNFAARHPDIDVELVGFHGHTILHRPAERRTWQIGDGALLARLTGIDVVARFPQRRCRRRRRGRAAWRRSTTPRSPPSWPSRSRCSTSAGSAMSPGSAPRPDDILAFDTGPGNALIDDWVRRHTGEAADIDGALALRRAGFGSACRAFSRSPLFRAPAAEIARPRRISRRRSRRPRRSPTAPRR